MSKRKTVVIEVALSTRLREKQIGKFSAAKIVLKQRKVGGFIVGGSGEEAHKECVKRANEFHDFLFHYSTGDFYQELKNLMMKY